MSGTVVVGDVLLDRDVIGEVERVSPDAPVPVVEPVAERIRAGGAGLAAGAALDAGGTITLITGLADDAAGETVRSMLADAGVGIIAFPRHGATPEKIRIRAADQSLLRIDRGDPGPHPVEVDRKIMEEALFGAKAILVSDYGGGVTADPVVRDTLARAALGQPVVWDPHPKGSPPVPGCALCTPNRTELASATGLPVSDIGELVVAARQLRSAWAAKGVCVTLGADGAALIASPDEVAVFPSPSVRVGDPCGAGDVFASNAALALGDHLPLGEAIERAVDSASRTVADDSLSWYCGPELERTLGTTAIGGNNVRTIVRPRVVVATSGCFDLLHAGHVRMLQAAAALGDRLVVCLNDDASVRRLKGAGRPIVPAEERAELLRSLSCVDEVVPFNEDTPERVLDAIRPAIFAKGGDYAVEDLPEAKLLPTWNGVTVILPYEAGRSTTELIARSRVAVGRS